MLGNEIAHIKQKKKEKMCKKYLLIQMWGGQRRESLKVFTTHTEGWDQFTEKLNKWLIAKKAFNYLWAPDLSMTAIFSQVLTYWPVVLIGVHLKLSCSGENNQSFTYSGALFVSVGLRDTSAGIPAAHFRSDSTQFACIWILRQKWTELSHVS